MELITVVVPVYNVEKYIGQCLESILAQTYKRLEIIMVDDGSTDSSGEVCEYYAQKYKHFRVIHKHNAGLGMARNTGMEYMSGDYVMFLDSDDYIDSDLIESLYVSIKKNSTDIAKSGFKRVNNAGNILSIRNYSDEVFSGKKAATDFLPRLIGSAPNKKDSYEMSVCASLYKTNIIRKKHILFPSERELISEDLIFNIEYTQYANGACVISKTGYNYRYNPTSLTKKYNPNKFEACVKFHTYVRNRLLELGYENKILYRLDRIFFVNTRGCIKQVKSLDYACAIRNINNICNNKILQATINEYPIRKLGIKQKLFIYMLKYRLSILLDLCVQINLL